VIQVTWEDGVSNGGSPITHYNLIIYPESSPAQQQIVTIHNEQNQVEFEAKTYQFTGLERATRYNIRVLAGNVIGSSQALSFDCTTSRTVRVPDAPVAECGAIDRESIVLNWVDGAYNGGADIT